MMKRQIVSRRQFLSIVGVGVTGSLLAACAPSTVPSGGQAQAAEGAAETREITYLVREFETDGLGLETDEWHRERFQEAFPEAVATPVFIPGAQYADKLQTMIAGGIPPDIFNVDPTSRWLSWIKNGTILDLTDLYEDDLDFFADWSDFFIRNQTWQDKMYGITIDGGAVYNLWYNATWFSESGVAEPIPDIENGWSVDDFLAVCQALSQPDEKRFAYNPFTAIWHWWPMTFGGGVVDRENPTKCILDLPESMEALQFLVDLRWKYNVVPQPAQEVEGQSGRQGFAANRTAMVHAGAWFLPTLEGLDLEAGVVYPPKAKDELIIMGTVQMYVTYAGAAHPDLCWEFNKLRIDEESCRRLVQRGSTTPNVKINEEVWLPAMEELAANGKGYKNYRAFLDGYAHTYMWAQMPQEAWDVLHAELDAVWLNQKSVDEYVSTTVPKVDQILQEWWES